VLVLELLREEFQRYRDLSSAERDAARENRQQMTPEEREAERGKRRQKDERPNR